MAKWLASVQAACTLCNDVGLNCGGAQINKQNKVMEFVNICHIQVNPVLKYVCICYVWFLII